MARRRSDKFLALIPEKYTPNFDDHIDGRTTIGKALLERRTAIESDLGGVEHLSHARRSLVKRAVWLECIVESYEQQIATRQQIDLGAYTQAINSLIGLYRLLGLERKARSVGAIERLRQKRQPVTVDGATGTSGGASA